MNERWTKTEIRQTEIGMRAWKAEQSEWQNARTVVWNAEEAELERIRLWLVS